MGPIPLVQRALLLLLLMFGGCTQARGQAVQIVDSSTTSGEVASFSWSHSVSPSINRGLLVSISTGQDARVTNVSYGGQNLIRVVSSVGPSQQGSVEIWGMADPPQGTANVTVTMDRVRKFVAGALTLSGVNLSSPLISIGSASGSTTSATYSVSTNENTFFFAALSTQGNAGPASAVASQTAQWNIVTGAGGTDVLGAAVTATTLTQQTMGWTLGSSRAWSLAVVGIRPVPPSVQVSATTTVLSDPVNGANNPKTIPGALVRYCLIAANPATAPIAQAVTLSSAISSLPITYVAGTLRVNGTMSGSSCNFSTGAAGGSITNGNVNATLDDLSPGQTRTVYFDATVN